MDKPNILELQGDNIGEVNFNSNVAGTTFREGTDKFLIFLRDNVPFSYLKLYLEREPNNPHDENAVLVSVGVFGSDRKRAVGYVPRDRARVLSYVIANPNEYELEIEDIVIAGGTEDKPFPGLFFNYKIYKV